MKTSFIIPTYNRKDLTTYTINSIIKNTLRHEIEVIVVDDGSSDGTGQHVAHQFNYANVSVIFQANRGAPTAINNGIKKATGKFILIIGSDDLIEPGFLKPRLDALIQNDHAIASYGPIDHFASKGKFEEKDVIPRHTPYPVEDANYAKILLRLLGGWYIPSPTILWRKEVFEKVGYLDPNLPVNQDVEFLYRVLKNGLPLIGTSGGRALIREHTGHRVGQINGNSKKLKAILQLRKRFYSELVELGLWQEDHAYSLSRYLFDYWVNYRKEFPELMQEFLSFSNELYPELNVEGSKPLEYLGKYLGKEKAVEIKDFINKFRR